MADNQEQKQHKLNLVLIFLAGLLAIALLYLAFITSSLVFITPNTTNTKESETPKTVQTSDTGSSITWQEAVELIKNCKVASLNEAHSLRVGLRLKDGTTLATTEPKINEVLFEVQKAYSKCGSLPMTSADK